MKSAEEFIRANCGFDVEELGIDLAIAIEILEKYGKECYNEGVEDSKKIVWGHRMNPKPSIAYINDELTELKK